MNDQTFRPDETPQADHLAMPDKLCDYMRKMRESKRISIEKMARDTRLNLDYLYALEQGDYQVLPAETYTRIYLRAVAKYLQINPDEVISRYDREFPSKMQQEHKIPTRGLKALSSQPKIKPFAILVLILAAVILFSFLRTGNNIPPVSVIPVLPDSSEQKPLKEKAEVPSTAGDTSLTVQEAQSEKMESVVANDSLLKLTVKCDYESSWVEVYADSSRIGRQVLHEGQTRSFAAKRNFQVAVGRASCLSMTLNRKKVNLPREIRNVFRFYLDRKSLKQYNLRQWSGMFPDSSGSP